MSTASTTPCTGRIYPLARQQAQVLRHQAVTEFMDALQTRVAALLHRPALASRSTSHQGA